MLKIQKKILIIILIILVSVILQKEQVKAMMPSNIEKNQSIIEQKKVFASKRYNIRKESNLNCEIIGTIDKGEQIIILQDITTNWKMIKNSQGRVGYILI